MTQKQTFLSTCIIVLFMSFVFVLPSQGQIPELIRRPSNTGVAGESSIDNRAPELAAIDKRWHQLFEEGTPYLEIPIVGTIKFPMSRVIARSLSLAEESGIRHAVLIVDSPGGSVEEAEAIVKAMLAHPKLTFHAFVNNGISAAVWPVMACHSIHMAEVSSLGGALVYSKNETTGNLEVDRKLNSILCAQVAALAESRGHSGDLVRGMMLPEEAIYYTKVGGHVKISRSHPINEPAELLKQPGRVMTITRKQAIDVGLCTGSATDLQGIAKDRGLRKFIRIHGCDLDVGTWSVMSKFSSSIADYAEKCSIQKKLDESNIRDANSRMRLGNIMSGRKFNYVKYWRACSASYARLADVDPRLYPRYWDADHAEWVVESHERWKLMRDEAMKVVSNIEYAQTRANEIMVQVWLTYRDFDYINQSINGRDSVMNEHRKSLIGLYRSDDPPR